MLTVTVIYWLLPARLRGGWLILSTLTILASLDYMSAAILCVLTGSIYQLAARHESISGKKLIGIIVFIAFVLGFYKARASMAGFTIESAGEFDENLLIPLGLSYYTFRLIHYAIEKYRHAIPSHRFYDFAQYMFFLPTLTAGPIHRFPEFERDLKRMRWDPFLFAEGLERIIYGYVKIRFIANLLLNFIFVLYINEIMPENRALGSYLYMIQIGLNLYFLFSGYSDVAIGFGMLLGFRVMENFNYPFLAKNISDFWRRWHISLTSWCRDYVYMGTLATARNKALAAVAAMLIMGLWHEFSLRYVLWGVYQGTGIIIWQQFQNYKHMLPAPKNRALIAVLGIGSTLLTLHYVLIGFMLVRHDTIGQALTFLKTIFWFWS
jgi:alginate O-acetyltransferase complex protein AlgI